MITKKRFTSDSAQVFELVAEWFTSSKQAARCHNYVIDVNMTYFIDISHCLTFSLLA